MSVPILLSIQPNLQYSEVMCGWLSNVVSNSSGFMLGVVSSLVVVVFVESQRKPRLKLIIDEPSDQRYNEGLPAQVMRCLRVIVANETLPRLLRWWMKREAAIDCLGTVEFLRLDHTEVFGKPMPGRWSGSPECVPLTGVLHQAGGLPPLPIQLWDNARLSIISKMNIPAGEKEQLDLVVRCDEDEDAFGFNNESYQHRWRNPNWRLPKGRYLIRVTIRSSGQVERGTFLLNNDFGINEFRLDYHPGQ